MAHDTHTKFREFIRRRGISPLEAMDRLQDFGMVSDNAVTLDDCAAVNLEEAIKDQRWITNEP